MIYVKIPWAEDEIHSDDPEWLYYEVDEATDVVHRIVELIDDGRAIRDSIKLAEREGPDYREPKFRSLVHGPFLNNPETPEPLTPSSREEFEKMWNSATDKPWPE